MYGAPELTRTVRVGSEGSIRLPMLRQRIRAEGKLPGELETVIAEALTAERILVDPIVTVTVVEYYQPADHGWRGGAQAAHLSGVRHGDADGCAGTRGGT